MATDKHSLIQTLLLNKEKIMQYGVARLGLFGSFVRNEMNEKSDVDIMVDFQSGEKNFRNFISLNYLLEELTGRKVDVATKESLTLHRAPKILNETEYVL